MSNIIDKIQLSGVTYDIGGSGSVSTAITSGDTNAVAGGAVYDKFDEVEQVTAAALNELNDKVNPTVELTQAQYDALVTAGTVQQDTYYIITDATAVDMANYYTTAQTNSLLSGKQNTLVSGTNIKTINNESILGSGNISVEGKGVVGSESISVSTGTTDYTINFTPSIWAGSAGNSIKENYSSNTASGSYSHAEGYNTTATGSYSHAEGRGTTAGTGSYTHAEGYNTTASGNYSHAEGYNTKASAYHAHTEGSTTTASGEASHAEGSRTTANTLYAHAEGVYTLASGSGSHAEGYNTNATGSYSHAEGRYTTAQNEAEHASGRYNVSSKANTTFGDSGNTLFSVGNGEDSEYRHNALDIRQNGDIYIVDTSASGDYYAKPMIKLQESLGGTVSTAITRGDTNAVAGGAVYNRFDEVEQVTAQALNVLNDRLDEDEEVTAAALVSLNEALSGKQDTLSAGTNITIVDNVISAEGGGSTYTAGDGIDITNSVISISLPISAGTGSNSIIEGHTGNTASGDYSHAEGYNTTASTDYVHAEGYSTKASGLFAHAEGGNTSANGTYSHAEGNCTITTNKVEHASGQFNTSNKANTTFGDSGNTLFSVGNGTANNSRHNAFEIRQNGDIYISSGGTDIKLQDHLGGGGGTSYTAGDGIDITNDVISVTGKTNQSDFTTHTANTTVHVTAQDKTNWNAKSDFSGDYDDLTNKPTIPTVPTDISAFNNDVGYITGVDLSNYATVDNLTAATDDMATKTWVGQQGYLTEHQSLTAYSTTEQVNTAISQATSGKADSSTVTALTSTVTAHTANTTVHVTSSDKSSWNGAATNASNAVTALGGLKLVKLSQSAYDNLQNKDSNTLYVIVN